MHDDARQGSTRAGASVDRGLGRESVGASRVGVVHRVGADVERGDTARKQSATRVTVGVAGAN